MHSGSIPGLTPPHALARLRKILLSTLRVSDHVTPQLAKSSQASRCSSRVSICGGCLLGDVCLRLRTFPLTLTALSPVPWSQLALRQLF